MVDWGTECDDALLDGEPSSSSVTSDGWAKDPLLTKALIHWFAECDQALLTVEASLSEKPVDGWTKEPLIKEFMGRWGSECDAAIEDLAEDDNGVLGVEVPPTPIDRSMAEPGPLIQRRRRNLVLAALVAGLVAVPTVLLVGQDAENRVETVTTDRDRSGQYLPTPTTSEALPLHPGVVVPTVVPARPGAATVPSSGSSNTTLPRSGPGAGPGTGLQNQLRASAPTVNLTDVSLSGDRQLTGTLTVIDNGAPSRCVLVVNGNETPGGCGSITVGSLTYATMYTVFAYAVNAVGRSANSGQFSVSTCDNTETAVALASTRSGKGYWRVDSQGSVSCFGDASFHRSLTRVAVTAPVVGMAATSTGNGYWLATADGGIFAFGDASGYGSMGSVPLSKPVVGMAATPTGRGYWLVAADGGVFAFGDAGFFGSTGNLHLNQPVDGIAAG